MMGPVEILVILAVIVVLAVVIVSGIKKQRSQQSDWDDFSPNAMPNAVFCPQCGVKNKSDASFCKVCGTPLAHE